MAYKFKNLSDEDQWEYHERAANLVYIGLASAGSNHDKVIKTLAKALYKVDVLLQDGEDG